MARKQSMPLFDGFQIQMNAFLAAVLYVGIINMNSDHQNGRGCNTEDYQRKFQRVVVSEFATFCLFMVAVWFGVARTVVMLFKRGKEIHPSKYSKSGVIAQALTLASFIGLMFVGFFLYQYQFAGISFE